MCAYAELKALRLCGQDASIPLFSEALAVIRGRGPLIDEEALIAGLQSGHIGGAGLDVTAVEPCPPENPLFHMSNVLLTPHYAPTTREAAVATSRLSAQNVLDFLAGKEIEGRLV